MRSLRHQTRNKRLVKGNCIVNVNWIIEGMENQRELVLPRLLIICSFQCVNVTA
jgi:hypothetical protein